ncbi:MAG: glycerol kinase [Lachnospiraceae bacterium]|nr:glycerol kinase [Lachnospiraceae bacterium]
MEKKYILVLDEGTTGLRSIVMDREFNIVAQSYAKIDTKHPGPYDVEQDANEIYEKQVKTMREAVKEAGIEAEEIAAVGISVQRGTFTYWNKVTGEPLYPFLVWLDTRGVRSTAKFLADKEFCEKYPAVVGLLKVYGGSQFSRNMTLLDENPELAEAIKNPDVIYGGIDAWLIYKLTGGKVFAASLSHTGTLPIYDKINCDYLYEPLEYVGIRREMLPEVRDDSGFFGNLDPSILGVEIPIVSCVADQQAALFSEGCLEPGTVKCTMGTGSFMDINLGDSFYLVPGMSTHLAWRIGEDKKYMAEGAVVTCGACLEWAKNNLGIIDDFSTMEAVASSVPDNGGVYFVPALNGMAGLPFRSDGGRASFMGISAGTVKAHFVRAVLESLAFSTAHVFNNVMASNEGLELNTINLDGGVSRSPIVCQLLADLTGAKVVRQKAPEASALGAAEMAAIGIGWMTKEDVVKRITIDREYTPAEDTTKVKEEYAYWVKAAERSKNWL